MSNKISLSIAGLNLIINTSEAEDRVRKLTAVLNQDMTQVLESNPSASVTNAALLCALDYLSQFDKATKSANSLRTQIKEYLSDAAKSKLEADEASRKNAALTEENQSLRERVTRMAANEASGSNTEENLRRQLEMSSAESNAVRRQLRETMDQNATLQNTIKNQSESLISQSTEFTRLTELAAQQKAQLDQQSKMLADLQKGAAAIRDDRDRLLQEREERESALNDLNHALEESRAERDIMLERLNATAAGKADAEARLTAAGKENAELKDLLAQTNGQKDAVQSTLDTLTSEKTEMESMLNDAYRENETLRKYVFDLQQNEAGLRGRLEAIHDELERIRQNRAEEEAAAIDTFFLNTPAAAEEKEDTLSLPDEEEEKTVPAFEMKKEDTSADGKFDFDADTSVFRIPEVPEAAAEKETAVPFQETAANYEDTEEEDIAKRLAGDDLFAGLSDFTFDASPADTSFGLDSSFLTGFDFSKPSSPREFVPEKNSRTVFDIQGGKISGDSSEVGVGDDFLTFGQMIAAENHRNKQATKSAADDDDLPDLSWINDIE